MIGVLLCLAILAVWTLLSLPFAVLVGRRMARRVEQS